MKRIFTAIALFVAVNFAFSQDTYTSIGVGYTFANVNQPKFGDLLVRVNGENAGLTTPFSTDNLAQGFNFFGSTGSDKVQIGFTWSQIYNRYKAEGVIPLISPNSAGYKISARLTQVSGQLDFFPIKFIGLGADGGYSYSTFRNEQKDLIFGETNSVVDKKGGLHGGLHLILKARLGRKAYFMLQPYLSRTFYKNNMDNVAAIYLGQGNSAAKKTELTATGVQIKLAAKIQ